MPQPFEVCNDLNELNIKERLNYVLGQVLGVKDFQQEQAYFLHKSRRHNRSLHGYGTIWGLDVTVETEDDALEIQVFPGLAVDPVGREICIETLQCARLDRWLTEGDNLEQLREAAEGDRLSVYVVLCYCHCLTEPQPILGNPCRTDSGEDGVIQYTRIRDDFELKLLMEPPDQAEEDYVRAIGALLARIEIDPSADDSADAVDALEEQLREAVDDPTTIPDSVTFVLPEGESRRILRTLLRYWVTHTRPGVGEAEDKEDCCLLLALVEFGLTEDRIDLETLTVVNQQRPYLLHTRLLQELLLRNLTHLPGTDIVLGAGNARYQNLVDSPDIEDLAGVFPAASPDPADANVALDVVVPRPRHGRGVVAYTSGDFEEPNGPRVVRADAPADPADAEVAFDVFLPLPNLGDGGVFFDGSEDANDRGYEAPGLYPKLVGERAEEEIAFDVVIPRISVTEPTPLLEQTFLRPVDLQLSFSNQDLEEGIPEAIAAEFGEFNFTPARLSTVWGYPALEFEDGGSAAFTTLRPRTVDPNTTPQLQLYVTARRPIERTTWHIGWKWIRLSDEPELPLELEGTPRNYATQQLSIFSSRVSHTDFLPLVNGEGADYLWVYLTPEEQSQFYLLMAELTWGEV